jgi:hypothetical protein
VRGRQACALFQSQEARLPPHAAGTQYSWTLTTVDSNGNQASIQTYFVTQ